MTSTVVGPSDRGRLDLYVNQNQRQDHQNRLQDHQNRPNKQPHPPVGAPHMYGSDGPVCTQLMNINVPERH